MSCCCICCSSNYQYWQLQQTAICLLSEINKLETGQTFNDVCNAVDCQAKRGDAKEQVSGNECESPSATPIANSNKCYYCHDCYAVCGSVYLDGCAPEEWCQADLETNPYVCRRPGVFAAQPCTGNFDENICELCFNNPPSSTDPNYSTWQTTCQNKDRGQCPQPALRCVTATPPTGGSGECYTYEPDPYTTDCSTKSCPSTGQPCGDPVNGPCIAGYYEYSSIKSIDVGQDECDNSYTACGVSCDFVITFFDNGCTYPSCCNCDCSGANAGSPCCPS